MDLLSINRNSEKNTLDLKFQIFDIDQSSMEIL